MAARAPAHLSKEMQKFYKSIMAEFALESHHIVLLTRACEHLDRAAQARRQVDLEGLTTIDRYGGIKPHPCAKLEIDNNAAARLLLKELGLDLEPAGNQGD